MAYWVVRMGFINFWPRVCLGTCVCKYRCNKCSQFSIFVDFTGSCLLLHLFNTDVCMLPYYTSAFFLTSWLCAILNVLGHLTIRFTLYDLSFPVHNILGHIYLIGPIRLGISVLHLTTNGPRPLSQLTTPHWRITHTPRQNPTTLTKPWFVSTANVLWHLHD